MLFDGSKLPAFYADDKTDWEAKGFRASPEHAELIERAAKQLGLKPGHFMLQACVEAALMVTGQPTA